MLNIPQKFSILGVIIIGYPEEKIINKTDGLRLKTSWNVRDTDL